ncbi:hypothetical protein C6988_00555 [Nitrosopumilus sp. b1]|uniref:hypothetical protein n=1 Tax=Nitrosopumilus sp. b1 TaxID=2109907 RepID=UPI0015F75C21|nr:hypothetical protein [Nitrosopumilus sp. b1]KAF6243938.1 hypothetical protein C6988_00555 [Nitrosopumilus sp. b1]
MTNLNKNKLPLLLGTAFLAITIAYGGTVFASHSFELGTSAGTIPDNTHIRLNDITMQPGDIFPLYDSSPNYVSGHVLLKAPCEPVEEGDDTYQPTVALIAGHVDENLEHANMQLVPLFYINAISKTTEPSSCIWHAHIPDPLNGGAPRVTDIDLINLSDEAISFGDVDVVDINIQQVLGSIGTDQYHDGPVLGFGPGDHNPVYDLNDDDHMNDGLGHS